MRACAGSAALKRKSLLSTILPKQPFALFSIINQLLLLLYSLFSLSHYLYCYFLFFSSFPLNTPCDVAQNVKIENPYSTKNIIFISPLHPTAPLPCTQFIKRFSVIFSSGKKVTKSTNSTKTMYKKHAKLALKKATFFLTNSAKQVCECESIDVMSALCENELC